MLSLVQQILNGLTLGGIYALIALGYNLVYGILLMINFAHSELFMSGAFVGLGVMTLLEQPEQLAVIREDPRRTPDAVEELLRYFTIAEFATARVATQDVEIGGVPIRAGEGVLALANAANRDPAAFEDGDALDVERGARHHVAFGFGAHQCLGQNLARLELQIVFDTLFRRVPGLRLAASVDDLPFKNDAAIYGLYELPVTWGEA